MAFTSLPSRLLTMILRIMVLVALAPVVGLGHSGHDHSTERSAPAEYAAVPDHAVTEMPAGKAHDDQAAATDACSGCGSCQAFVTQASDTARGVWGKAGCVASGPDLALPSVVPETLPEPPRSFA